jgi:hypothetical protein
MTNKRWRSLIRALRKNSDISGKVTVRRRPLKKLCGHTVFDLEGYSIPVASDMDSQAQAETLVHEWAHVLAIEAGCAHGEVFGEMYSRVLLLLEKNYPDGEMQ